MIMTHSVNVADLVLSRTVRQLTVTYSEASNLLLLCVVSMDFSVVFATKYNFKRSCIFLLVKPGRIKASFLYILICLYCYRPNILLPFLDTMKMYCIQRLIYNTLQYAYHFLLFSVTISYFTELNSHSVNSA